MITAHKSEIKRNPVSNKWRLGFFYWAARMVLIDKVVEYKFLSKKRPKNQVN
jgi:hypothetical protein